jgi:two-component sensor histidine kinase
MGDWPECIVDRPDLDYFGLFDASPNPYLVLDRDLHIVGANKAYLKATKRELGDIVGRWAWDAFPTDPDTLREAIASFQRVIRDREPDTLALLRFDIPRPESEGGGFETRYWSIVASPVLDGAGEVSVMLQHPIDVTELQRLRDAVQDTENRRPAEPAPAQSGIFERAQAVHETNRWLHAESGRLRRLFQQAPGFMCVLRGPDHRFELVNDAYLQLVGHRDIVGKPLLDALPELVGQGFVELLDKVYRTGEAFVGRGLRFMVQRTPDAPLEESFTDFVYQPITDEDGRVSGIFVEGSDVTDRVRAMDQQRLLIAELNHRVKNTLATVQSIAAQTLRSTPSPEDFRRSFEARLVALSHTHDALTRTHWQGADLRRLLEKELGPYGESRIALHGADVLLQPGAALALGLVFHELATNAAKYGALSAEAGRVSVRWKATDGPDGRHLVLDWTEAGGPPVAVPRRRGFGSRLIERSLGGESGEACLDFRPEGVAARLRVRLRPAPAGPVARRAGGSVAGQAPPADRNARIGGAINAPAEMSS